MRRFLLFLSLLLAISIATPAQNNRRAGQRQTQPKAKQTTRKPTKREQLLQQQQRLRKEREANQRRQRELEAQCKKKMSDVEALTTEISDKQQLIDSLQQELSATDSSIAQLNTQLEQLKAELRERQQRYIKSMRYMYRTSRSQNDMLFILSAENFNQMYRRTRFSGEYATYQRAQGEAVKQKREQVGRKQQELSDARQRQASLLNRGVQEHQQLTAKQQEQQRMVQDLRKQQRTVQDLIAQQKQQEADLDKQINKLVQEEMAAAQRRAEEERRRREQQAAAAARPSQPSQRGNSSGSNNSSSNSRKRHSGKNNDFVENNVTAADNLSNKSFAKCKGKLPPPITGPYRIVRNFGTYSVSGLPNVTLDSKGIHLEGQAGANARCVFDGEVSSVFNTAGRYIVMVRHGNYISVYCNLASVSVRSGQKVKAQQTLGALPQDHTLQFRLQKGFDILNPRKWLAK